MSKKHVPTITFNLEPEEKNLLYRLAAELGFVNPPGSGNYAGDPSPRRLIKALVNHYGRNPETTKAVLMKLNLSDPLPPEADFWKKSED